MRDKSCETYCPKCWHGGNEYSEPTYQSDDEQIFNFICGKCGQEYEEHFTVTVKYETTRFKDNTTKTNVA